MNKRFDTILEPGCLVGVRLEFIWKKKLQLQL